jgi:thiamine transporter ThiT
MYKAIRFFLPGFLHFLSDHSLLQAPSQLFLDYLASIPVISIIVLVRN